MMQLPCSRGDNTTMPSACFDIPWHWANVKLQGIKAITATTTRRPPPRLHGDDAELTKFNVASRMTVFVVNSKSKILTISNSTCSTTTKFLISIFQGVISINLDSSFIDRSKLWAMLIIIVHIVASKSCSVSCSTSPCRIMQVPWTVTTSATYKNGITSC